MKIKPKRPQTNKRTRPQRTPIKGCLKQKHTFKQNQR